MLIDNFIIIRQKGDGTSVFQYKVTKISEAIKSMSQRSEYNISTNVNNDTDDIS
jgi:hypothetical protein